MIRVEIAAARQVATKTAPWSMPAFDEDLRVDEHDVDHREEGGHAGDELGADGGAVLGQAELAVEKAGKRTPALRRAGIGHVPAPVSIGPARHDSKSAALSFPPARVVWIPVACEIAAGSAGTIHEASSELIVAERGDLAWLLCRTPVIILPHWQVTWLLVP